MTDYSTWTYKLGDLLTKTKGSSWTGHVVGFYSTSLTPEGYAIESINEPGSVQIYPVSALRRCDPAARNDRIAALEAENEHLKSLVAGWYYLEVGPDEMGDYYTHKALVKASKPYASPALAALGDEA